MTYYAPCQTCAVDRTTCDQKKKVAKALAGIWATSIKFRCPKREPKFHPGQRVLFDWRHYEPNDWGDSDRFDLRFAGTVVAEKGLRFIVRVDEGDCIDSSDGETIPASTVFKNDRLIIKVKPADMLPRDEPDRVICPECCAYEDETGRCHGHGDPKSWDSYWPSGCLRIPQEAKD